MRDRSSHPRTSRRAQGAILTVDRRWVWRGCWISEFGGSMEVPKKREQVSETRTETYSSLISDWRQDKTGHKFEVAVHRQGIGDWLSSEAVDGKSGKLHLVGSITWRIWAMGNPTGSSWPFRRSLTLLVPKYLYTFLLLSKLFFSPRILIIFLKKFNDGDLDPKVNLFFTNYQRFYITCQNRTVRGKSTWRLLLFLRRWLSSSSSAGPVIHVQVTGLLGRNFVFFSVNISSRALKVFSFFIFFLALRVLKFLIFRSCWLQERILLLRSLRLDHWIHELFSFLC